MEAFSRRGANFFRNESASVEAFSRRGANFFRNGSASVEAFSRRGANFFRNGSASVEAFSRRGENFFRNGSASVEAMISPVARSARLVAWPGFWLARYCPFSEPRGLARLLAYLMSSLHAWLLGQASG